MRCNALTADIRDGRRENGESIYMGIPDVIGFTVDEAVQVLDTVGIIHYEVEVLSPPGHTESGYDKHYRVIRINAVESSKVKLLVCKPLKL
ncbi:MAG: hypothetical protein NUV41_01940 [Eubacteriales bacterium]|nr:hypothetical protein [Eubacteriales bacterium]